MTQLQMSAVVVEVLAAKAHGRARRDVSAGNDKPGDRGQHLE
jgi:hypothetical protein